MQFLITPFSLPPFLFPSCLFPLSYSPVVYSPFYSPVIHSPCVCSPVVYSPLYEDCKSLLARSRQLDTRELLREMTSWRTRAGRTNPFRGHSPGAYRRFRLSCPGRSLRHTALDYLLSVMAWEGHTLSRGPLSLTWKGEAFSGVTQKSFWTTGQRLEGRSRFRGPLAKQGRHLGIACWSWEGHTLSRGHSAILRHAGSPSTIEHDLLHSTCWCLRPLLLSDSQGCSQSIREVIDCWGTSAQRPGRDTAISGTTLPIQTPWENVVAGMSWKGKAISGVVRNIETCGHSLNTLAMPPRDCTGHRTY